MTQPVSVDETYVYYQPMFLEGVPSEINETRLRFHEFGFGPAGFISPDDVEIMERNQIGVSRADLTMSLSSGAASIGRRSWRTVAPARFTMDENHLRGMWTHYAKLMRDPSVAAFVAGA